MSEIKEAQQEDESLETLIASVQWVKELPMSIQKQYHQYKWAEDLLWYNNNILVPDNPELQKKILHMHHNSPIAGHQGRVRTLELIK